MPASLGSSPLKISSRRTNSPTTQIRRFRRFGGGFDARDDNKPCQRCYLYGPEGCKQEEIEEISHGTDKPSVTRSPVYETGDKQSSGLRSISKSPIGRSLIDLEPPSSWQLRTVLIFTNIRPTRSEKRSEGLVGTRKPILQPDPSIGLCRVRRARVVIKGPGCRRPKTTPCL